MNRGRFLTLLGGTVAMSTLTGLRSWATTFRPSEVRMPVLFVGHGSPMNGIEDNPFSAYWKKLAAEIPKPSAVLCVSAHWLTKGTFVTAMEQPRTIHDFGGFPDELFAVQYPAPGSPELARSTSELVTSIEIELDHEWGLDHGTWTVVRHMYPDADIPVLQLSIDYHKPASYHYELARELTALRNKGVLIIGSGNIVHNLRMIDWQHVNEFHAYDWAAEIDNLVRDKTLNGDFNALINYDRLHSEILKAIPTPDHYYPFIYALGMVQPSEPIEVFNDHPVGGSITMTSYRFG